MVSIGQLADAVFLLDFVVIIAGQARFELFRVLQIFGRRDILILKAGKNDAIIPR